MVGFLLTTHYSLPTVSAFIGPSTGQTPGSGGGLFNVDANRNIGFGTASSTPVSTFDNVGGGGGENHGYVFLVASTSNPGLGLRNTSLNHMYLWSVRNIGSQSRIDLYRESPVLPGKVLLSINEGGFVGISAAPTSTYRLIVEGNIYASGTLSSANPISGSLSAANVTGPSAFGSNYGTYSYAAPGAFAVGTTTTTGLPTNGLFVVGDVGIGTASPGGTAPNAYSHIANETNELEIRARLDGRDSGVFVRDFDGTPGLDLWQDGSTGNAYVDSRYAGNDLTGTIFRTKTSGTPVTNMVLLGNGRTGVGTTTPEAVFHSVTTASGSNDTGNAGIFQSTGGAGIVTIRSSALGNFAALYGSLGTDIVGAIDFRPTVGDISFWTNNVGGTTWTERARIVNSTGFVGIATTTPSDELTVFGDIRISKSGSALIFPDGTSQTTAGTGVTAWTKNGANVYLTTLTDSVGIGTSTPTYKLEVKADSNNQDLIRISHPTAPTGAGFSLGFGNVFGANDDSILGKVEYSFTDYNVFAINRANRDIAFVGNNVGIATTTPAEKLSVVGGGIFYGATGNLSAAIYYDRSHGGYYLDPFANEQPYSLIVAGGVGIGTTTPATMLNVLAASNQLRLNANATEYGNFSVAASTGVLTISTNAGSDPDIQLTPGTNGELNLGSTISITGGSTLNMGGGIISNLNEVYGENGSATDPSFTFSNSQQTGLFQSAGDLGLTASGTEVMRLTAAGNVGIGTSTPANKLDVFDSGDGRTAFSVSDASDYRLLVNMGGNDGIDFYKGTSLKFNTDASALNLWAGYALRSINSDLPLESAGNVSYGVNLRTYDGSAYQTRLRIDGGTNGYVGIATTTPSHALTVFGDIRISKSGSALIFPDGTTQTTSAVGGGGYWSLSGVNLYPTSTTYKVAIGSTVATSSLTVTGDGIFYGASGNISAGVYYDRSNTTYYLDPGANENAYSLTVAGNVGIGTTTPNSLLSLYGPSATLNIRTDGGTNGKVSIGSSVSVLELYSQSGAGYVKGGGSGSGALYLGVPNYLQAVTVLGSNGNVGVGTTTPAHLLTVAGTSYFGNQITLAAGVQIAATNNTNSISLAGGDITGVDKLTVTTIDPLYEIKGKKYSTYAASIAGGVKEEFVGRAKLVVDPSNGSDVPYSHVIDFSKVQEGSDLWVWYHAVAFSEGTVQVMATPAKTPVPIAYEISGNKIIFRANAAVEFSYRLIGNRFDWEKWPTYAKDQSEWTNLIVK